MDFESAQYGPALVFSPRGRLDQDSADIFKDELLLAVGSGSSTVIVDFAAIPYVSSIGLRSLMIAASHSNSIKVKLTVSGLVPAVEEIFRVSRFDRVLKVHETVREAVGAVSEDALKAFDAA